MLCHRSVSSFLYISVILFITNYVDGQEPKIVNGYNVTSMVGYNHQVSIRLIANDRVFGDGHRCGGSLINNRTVLTAAHCVHDGSRYMNASRFVIALGGLDRWVRDNNTLYIYASKVVGHRNFKLSTFENDIALITLAQDVPANHTTAKSIAIATESPAAGRSCVVSGWGSTAYEGGIQPNRLQMSTVTINSKAACNQPERHNGNVKNGMFCAGPFSGPLLTDSCQGDSGGPLVCGGILNGITSNGKGCALPNFPGVYIDVNYYRKWILAGDSTAIVGNFAIISSAALVLISYWRMY